MREGGTWSIAWSAFVAIPVLYVQYLYFNGNFITYNITNVGWRIESEPRAICMYVRTVRTRVRTYVLMRFWFDSVGERTAALRGVRA